ncbi:hypothetical protein [Kineococcus rubinsiae]|uniref:hypothetical protein n=1 Tax=Kineococcus rubinsiae TaxID=2609562 RepID=UPI00142FD62A|nr:hypothetical protein [Kineococcus rubinsiae]NIZ92445.1 hypothetical protein [Kineococcus rubinsiae]
MLALDRVLVLLLGLVLLVGGVATALWGAGRLPAAVTAPEELRTGALTRAFDASWWTAAAAVGGVVLALLGIRWLVGHLPARAGGTVALTGSAPGRRLALDLDSPVSVAADVLGTTAGVRSARGSLSRGPRGGRIVTLRAVVEPTADIPAVVTAAEGVCEDVLGVIGRTDVQARVQVAVARRARGLPRAS